MSLLRRTVLGAFAAGGMFPGLVTRSLAEGQAQGYPLRPLKVAVPFAAGGATDLLARRISDELKGVLLQPVVIDNRPGAGGVLGAALTARAPADGYALLFMTNSLCLQEAVKPPGKTYALLKDFAPVTSLYNLDLVLALSPSLPVRNVAELIAYAKARPGQLNYGSGGVGTTLHLGMELFKQMAGVEVTHVPYKDAPAARLDLINGTVHMMVDTANTALPFSQRGKIRILAQTGATRSEFMPGLPTVDESGLKGFRVESFAGLMVPAGTSDAVIAALRAAAATVLDRPQLREALQAQRATPVSLGPTEFRQLISSDILRWTHLLESTNLKLN